MKKFAEANPAYIKGKDCLYIGKTSHHPRCRQSQHNSCKVGDFEGKTWTCYCGKKSNTVNECKISNRTSKIVGKYMTGLMPKRYFKRHNPQASSSESEQVEQQLAKDLRKEGFGVWAGHLDRSTNNSQKTLK